MKKQALIFGIISIVASVLAFLSQIVLGFFSEINHCAGSWKDLEVSEIIAVIVILLFCTLVPAIVKAAIQIILAILALKPKAGKNAVLNYIAIFYGALIYPIVDYAFYKLIYGILDKLNFSADVLIIYMHSYGAPLTNILSAIAISFLVISSAFAIAEKKLGKVNIPSAD